MWIYLDGTLGMARDAISTSCRIVDSFRFGINLIGPVIVPISVGVVHISRSRLLGWLAGWNGGMAGWLLLFFLFAIFVQRKFGLGEMAQDEKAPQSTLLCHHCRCDGSSFSSDAAMMGPLQSSRDLYISQLRSGP